ncbi:YidB family protein [Streptomyces sp. NPDC003038]|uniref:YidB family protein n=1 Tax=unclassified Streptomyces TaxID=2593676 RepID=UPI0033B69564
MAGNDLGSLLGGLLGGGDKNSGAGNILGSLLGALVGGGGSHANAGSNPLDGLMGMLGKSGIADQANSWVSTGENKAVSGTQIDQALPDETLKKVAEQTGVSPQEAADQIAQSLPTAVDKLSPEGVLPTGSLEDLIRQQTR